MCEDASAAKVNPISESAYLRYKQLAMVRNLSKYTIQTRPVSEEGENSYGSVLQVILTPTHALHTLAKVSPDVSILKIAPRDSVRRSLMEVVKHYRREVYMFDKVLNAFTQLFHKRNNGTPDSEVMLTPRFDIVPRMHVYSLAELDEFIIFEDLSQSGYVQNPRHTMPTSDLVLAALKAIAQLHARSLVMQHQKHTEFEELIGQLGDNLFTRPMAEIPLMFGKYYIQRSYEALEEDEMSAEAEKKYEEETDESKKKKRQENRQIIQVMKKIEQDFEEIAVKSVDGRLYAPHAVICHGDFSNNNILYKFGPDGIAKFAKIVDFQMSCYSPPVCDVLRYIFTCTDKTLRDEHFQSFLDTYHKCLVQQLEALGCNSELYPRDVFDAQLRKHGVYAFIIASFAMPFLIAIKGEYPEMDRIAKDLTNLKAPGTDMTIRELVHRNNMLTPRSLPIFKRRMSDIIRDLIKYEMVPSLLEPPEDR